MGATPPARTPAPLPTPTYYGYVHGDSHCRRLRLGIFRQPERRHALRHRRHQRRRQLGQPAVHHPGCDGPIGAPWQTISTGGLVQQTACAGSRAALSPTPCRPRVSPPFVQSTRRAGHPASWRLPTHRLGLPYRPSANARRAPLKKQEMVGHPPPPRHVILASNCDIFPGPPCSICRSAEKDA